MIIREATTGDASGLARVSVDTWRSTYEGIVPQTYLDKLSYQRSESRWIKSLNERRNYTLVALTSEGEIAGFAVGGTNRTPSFEYDSELYAIYVHKENQGKGIGKMLFVTMCKYFSSCGMTSMILWALADNNYKYFYEAMGGSIIGSKTMEIGGKKLATVGYGWAKLMHT